MPATDDFLVVFQKWVDLFMHRSMRRFLHYARESGLSMSMIGTLFHLHRREKAGVTDVGDHLGVTSAAASQMLDRLVQQGLIERSEDPDDRRMKRISLTEKGNAVIKESINARLEWIEDLAEVLTADEKDQVITALNLMVVKVPKLAHNHHIQDPK